jgi:hypothetical protein
MSFQAYPNHINTQIGHDPTAFQKLVEQKGFLAKGKLKAGVKALDIVGRLSDEFDLGHGRSMALDAAFKGKNN